MKIFRERVVRSIGVNKTGAQLSFGFMDKPGITKDEIDSYFNYYSIVYVINGKGTYIDEDNTEYPLKKGSLFQRFPNRKHSTYIDPKSDWKECYMDFGKEIYNFLVSMRIIKEVDPVIENPLINNIEKNIQDLLLELKNCDELELPSILTKTISFYQEITTKLGNKGNRYDKAIDRACKDFTKDYRVRIDLIDYCKKEGLGYESFRKKFKERVGISPNKYIIRRRIDIACQMLRSTELTIGEVSEVLGYKNQYEFSSQFKKIIDISPFHYKTLNSKFL